MTEDGIYVIDWVGAKHMPFDEFVRLADPDRRALLTELWHNPLHMVDGVVCYQDENGSSESWGNRYFVLAGPGPKCGGLTLEPLLAVLHRGAGAIAYCEKEVKWT